MSSDDLYVAPAKPRRDVYRPETWIMKLKIGDEIKLTESDFAELLSAFFAEIEEKFL